jgi:hypothetical protein
VLPPVLLVSRDEVVALSNALNELFNGSAAIEEWE